jgi:hypothetical protein
MHPLEKLPPGDREGDEVAAGLRAIRRDDVGSLARRAIQQQDRTGSGGRDGATTSWA